jgi:uncharacterized protein YjiS (DUF1127 family)
MRFENNVLHLKSSVSRADDADDRIGLARSSAVSLGVSSKPGLQQKRLVPDALPHFVPAALSRLLAQAFGGLASCRDATNSALFSPVADYGETSPASTLPPLRARQNSTSLDPRAHRTPNGPRLALLRGSSGAIVSSIVAWRRRLRRKRDIRSAIAALESLDDWMLKDIGIHRYQIEHVVRWETIPDVWRSLPNGAISG